MRNSDLIFMPDSPSFPCEDSLSARLTTLPAGPQTRHWLNTPGNGAGGQARNRRCGMPTGTVKWFNGTKGYGFIAPDDGGKDVFVHISAVERAGLKGLNDNQKIGFDLQTGRDGKESAGDLRIL
jgi:cold shock protein